MSNNASKTERTRNWGFIMYPDSAPTNWREILVDYHVNIVISPLHNNDVNATGEPKKPHWHVVIMFDSVKTIKQAEEISKSVNGTIPIVCQSLNGMIRYLVHKDNPEKAQYSRDDIINIGSYNIDEAFKTSIDKYNTIGAMIDYIEEHDETEFYKFMLYCKDNNQEWFRSLCDSSYVIREYIKSRRNYIKDMERAAALA